MPDFGKIDRAFFDEHVYPHLGADREDVVLAPQHGVEAVLDALAGEAVPSADVGEVTEGSGLSVDGEAVEPPAHDPFWGAVERYAVEE